MNDLNTKIESAKQNRKTHKFIIQVYTEKDKEKLMALGYEFICALKQSDTLTIYQFKDNDKNINFSELNIQCHKSKFMLF